LHDDDQSPAEEHEVVMERRDALGPIFVGGCDRSGTTFLASLLGGHPDVVAPPEAQFLIDGMVRAKNGSESFYDIVRQHWRYQLWQLPELDHVVEPGSPAQVMRAVAGAFSAAVDKPRATRWVDHTPWNTQYSLVLHEIFPRAPFVHIVRDGRAVAHSAMNVDWGPTTARSAADWWLQRVAFGLATELRLPERTLRVSYEQLVTEPETELRRICGFIDIPFCESMLSRPEVAVPEYTRSQHALVGQKPDKNRLSAWQREMKSSDVRTFERTAGEMLQLLGYELHEPRTSTSIPSALADVLVQLRRRAVKRVQNHLRRRLTGR
jgi:hypothetical protein